MKLSAQLAVGQKEVLQIEMCLQCIARIGAVISDCAGESLIQILLNGEKH